MSKILDTAFKILITQHIQSVQKLLSQTSDLGSTLKNKNKMFSQDLPQNEAFSRYSRFNYYDFTSAKCIKRNTCIKLILRDDRGSYSE